MNLLDNTPNQPSKFRTKNLVDIMMIHGEGVTPIITLNLKLQ